MVYTKNDLLRLAKRYHNAKRKYLLINPLQGKHLPVSPTQSLEMMRALGSEMAAQAPEIDLVIGFAETATAVAAVAAGSMARPCRYIHTTRERFAGSDAVEFREDHSHAVEQYLSLTNLRRWIDEASAVAFVDDELSTGKTLENAIRQLREACPSFAGKRIYAGSVISRLTEAREEKLGLRCISLLRLPMNDRTEADLACDITGAKAPAGEPIDAETLSLPPVTGNPRLGVSVGDWMGKLRTVSMRCIEAFRPHLAGKRVTILGTEEYMLPGLLLGEALESMGISERVRFHATTRSPIGICDEESYPIRRGWRLHSFYEAERLTYIYNLEPCDTAIVLTDSPDDAAVGPALSDLTGALSEAGCGKAIMIREACHVQYL